MSALPEEFADLEQFAEKWSLPTEQERYAVRLATPMEEMQAFYDVMTPRLPAVMAYCDQFSIDALPDEVVNLMRLVYSLLSVSFPVEVWGQPRVPDTGAAAFPCFVEPVP
jgi:hypothetical protein